MCENWLLAFLSVPNISCVSFKLPNTGSNHSVNFLFYILQKKWLWVSLTWEISHWSCCWLSHLEGSQSNNGYLRIFEDLISEMSSSQGSIPFALPSCLFLKMAVNVKPPDRVVHPQKAKLLNWISRAGMLLDETYMLLRLQSLAIRTTSVNGRLCSQAML